MKRGGSRRAEAGRGKFTVVLLTGMLIGAAVAVATIVLLESEHVAMRAAAMAPLTAAVVVAGILVWRHGRSGPSGDVAAAAEVERGTRDAADHGAERERAGGGARAGDADRVRGAGGDAAWGGPTDSRGAPPDGSHAGGGAAQPEAAAEPGEGELDAEEGDAHDPDLPHDHADDSDDRPAEVSLAEISAALVEAWERYRREGDGFFTARGLQEELDALEFEATVQDGSALDAKRDVLLVTVGSGGGDGDGDRFFVVPSFVKSPGAAPDWFEDASSGALSTTTTTIHRIAEGRWTATSFKVVERGRIG